MALTPSASLYAASLAIYLVLLVPTIYIGFKHGKHGALGWYLINIFVLLQIVAGGILVHDNEHPTIAGSIVASVGLSPLLLGVAGLVHEAQLKILTGAKRRFAHILYFQIHALALAGIALLIVGLIKVYTGASGQDLETDLTLWKAGSALLLVAWILIVLVAASSKHEALSTRVAQHDARNAAVVHDVNILLRAVLISLPFIGVRTIVNMVYAVSRNPDLSPVTGSIAVKVVLQFLMQLLAVLAMIVGGFMTRHINERVVAPGRRLDTDVELPLK